MERRYAIAVSNALKMDAPTTRTNRLTRVIATVALAFASIAARPAELPPGERGVPLTEPMQFDIPEMPADDARRLFHRLTGLNVSLTKYGDVTVGPFSEYATPEKAWEALMARAGLSGFALNDRTLIAIPFSERKFDIDIGRVSRVQAIHELSTQTKMMMGYLPGTPDEEEELVGPIVGSKTLEGALGAIIAGSPLRFRWIDPRTLVVEQPLIRPPPSEQVTVVSSPLPMLGEYMDSPVSVIERDQIAQTGAATLAELLAYHSKVAFSTPDGIYASGAQFAEMRGVGADHTLVLINGRRAYATASDVSVNAFDLATIPIAAVERVEISYDSASIRHGTDAIGGVVNVILKQAVETPTAEISFGAASGEADQRRFSVSVGTNSEHSHAALVFDYFEAASAMGYERDRWADEDWTRFGGSDNRTRYGSPANFRSLDGSDLPGLGSSFAALQATSDSSLTLRPGHVNLRGLNAYRSISPDRRRLGISGFGSRSLGTSILSIEVLAGRRNSALTLAPNTVAGIFGAAHPQNPFGQDVFVEALLTGLPTPKVEVESNILRAGVSLHGPLRHWEYSLSLVSSDDRSRRALSNVTDPLAVAHSLITADADEALNVISPTPGAGNISHGLFRPDKISRYAIGATQFAGSVGGPLLSLPAGDISSEFGLERRRESVSFDRNVGERSRDVTSAFAQLRIPVIGSAMTVPAIRELSLSLGIRRDSYSDVSTANRTQFGATWQPLALVKMHVGISESFRPPSLYDLHFPRLTLPTQVIDPRRNEVVPIVVITGGNSDLDPTTGSSRNYGISIGKESGWRVSLNHWEIQMHDRISLLPFFGLLAHEGETDRVVRADPSEADLAAGRPGPLTAVDISRVNFGELSTDGWDVELRTPAFGTRAGTLTPRLDVTLTNHFWQRTLPGVPLTDRAGLASENGTITRARAIAALTYETKQWRSALLGRYHSSYRDWNAILAAQTNRTIPSNTVWDMQASRKLGEHAEMSVGMHDVLDEEPAYSAVSAAGFDPSLDGLRGRLIYLSISASW